MLHHVDNLEVGKLVYYHEIDGGLLTITKLSIQETDWSGMA